MIQIGQRLRELRLKNNLKQDDIIKRFSLSSGRYSQYETGKRRPDYELLMALADFYHVSIDYLLGHEVAQPDPPADTSEPADIKELIAKELPNMDAEDAAMMGQFMQFLKIKKGFGAKTANGNL